jgi:hypothetical protein
MFVQLLRWNTELPDVRLTADKGRMGGCIFDADAKILPDLLIQKLRLQIRVEQQHTIGNLIQCVAQQLQLVGVPDNIGHERVAQHPPAVRQHRALHPDHLAVGPAHTDRLGVTCIDLADSLGDVGVQLVCRTSKAFVSPVIQERNQSWPAVGHLVGQVPHPAKRAIDELGTQVTVEQHHAGLDLVERRPKRQHLRVHDGVASANGSVRLSGAIGLGLAGILEFETELLVGLPHALAGSWRPLACDAELVGMPSGVSVVTVAP